MSLADSFLSDLLSDDEDMPFKQEFIKSEASTISSTSSSSSSSSASSSSLKTEDDDTSFTKPTLLAPTVIISDLLAQPETISTISSLESAIKQVEIEEAEELRQRQSSMFGASAMLDALKQRQSMNASTSSDSDSDSDDDDDDGTPTLSELGVDASVVDVDGEQALITAANTLSRDLDLEINRVTQKVRAVYATKFPELADIVPAPIEYIKCVKLIGDSSDLSSLERPLRTFLPNAIVLTISVTAATTKNKIISSSDLNAVLSGCDVVEMLDSHRATVGRYLECTVSRLAPNLAAILSPPIAARMLTLAGGLRALVKIPSCNLQVLGSSKHALAGMSVTQSDIHFGVIGQCPVMQHVETHLRRKALRLIAGKCALAIRLDAGRESTDGAKGRDFADKINAKITKWQEPPPSRLHKPLPRPDEMKKKKRGGRKARMMKERHAQSEIAKHKNRLMFGQAEIVDEFTGEEMGMIGQQGSGILRIKHTDGQNIQNRLSKKMKARMGAGAGQHQGHQTSTSGIKTALGGTKTTLGGTTSVFAMTSDQGIELARNTMVDPTAILKKNDYFSQNSSFIRIRKHEDDGESQTGKKQKTLPNVPTF